MNDIIYYRRNLPHIHPHDGIFFITFRLAGTLPVNVIRQLREERNLALKSLDRKIPLKQLQKRKSDLDKRTFRKFDERLDEAATGPRWLANDKIARLVEDKMHALDGSHYRLIAYCIMSNHVHLLIKTAGFPVNVDYPVTDCLRRIKGRTARLCNLALGRRGAFWHHESYDHYVRDDDELARIIEYILNNPVKAGLIEDPGEWKYSYCNTTFMS